tara:strand:- start:1230 stop:2720 length:1491 start_codon:yes stop_codon:yes gene_type:complete
LRKLKFIIIISILSISTYAQNRKKIEIINADYTYVNNDLHPDYWRLIGNVNIRHNNTDMLCDSAYYYSNQERIKAFNNIKIYRGDSINLYGDALNYNGKDNIAVISRNVIFKNNKNTLKSEEIIFNIKEDHAFYNTRSEIINLKQKIISNKGEYDIHSKIYNFTDSVIVKTKDYLIKTNYLKYDTDSERNYIQGPSNIYIEDKIIYCENGFFDSSSNKAEFYKNSKIFSNEYSVYADSIFYNNKTKYAIAKSNVKLIDSINNFVLLGGVAEFYENDDKLIVYNNPLLKLFSDEDTLFMSSTKFINSTIGEKRYLTSYNNVKFLNNELKGKCDSLIYKITDSLILMYNNPIIWFDEYQVTSDNISISYYNKVINRIYLSPKPMIISKEDSSEFNQIKGKEMIGYFKKNKLYNLNVNGNGQSIYFLKDKDKKIGMNYIESSNISLNFRDNKIHKINYEIAPHSITTPLEDIKEKNKFLKGFKWRINEKPMDKKDIIIG